jgi:hypothetical protein
MGIVRVTNLMGVDCFTCTQHSSILKKTSKSLSMSSSEAPDRGRNLADKRYLRWLERFPKIEEIVVSKIF